MPIRRLLIAALLTAGLCVPARATTLTDTFTYTYSLGGTTQNLSFVLPETAVTPSYYSSFDQSFSTSVIASGYASFTTPGIFSLVLGNRLTLELDDSTTGQNEFTFISSGFTNGFSLTPAAPSDPQGQLILEFNPGFYTLAFSLIGTSTNSGFLPIDQASLTIERNVPAAVTPEPSTLVQLGTGVFCLAGIARRRITKA